MIVVKLLAAVIAIAYGYQELYQQTSANFIGWLAIAVGIVILLSCVAKVKHGKNGSTAWFTHIDNSNDSGSGDGGGGD